MLIKVRIVESVWSASIGILMANLIVVMVFITFWL